MAVNAPHKFLQHTVNALRNY